MTLKSYIVIMSLKYLYNKDMNIFSTWSHNFLTHLFKWDKKTTKSPYTPLSADSHCTRMHFNYKPP